jgi:hypothetical protein
MPSTEENGIQNYRDLRCYLTLYSEESFKAMGCSNNDVFNYFIPIDQVQTKIREIRCIKKNCTARTYYKAFNMSFGFGGSKLT